MRPKAALERVVGRDALDCSRDLQRVWVTKVCFSILTAGSVTDFLNC